MTLTVAVTGARGFIGKHTVDALALAGHRVIPLTHESSDVELDSALSQADVVVHLAGANRPADPVDFGRTNVDFTKDVCTRLRRSGSRARMIFSSSRQATSDNPYGQSKLSAESVVQDYAVSSNASACIFRLTNVFGRGCRPHYNSFVATLCHSIARDLPFHVDDAAKRLLLVYVDDVTAAIVDAVEQPGVPGQAAFCEAGPEEEMSLGDLVSLVRSFRDLRTGLFMPDVSTRLVKQLYATYLSYLPEDGFGYQLDVKRDPRGSLAEFLKSPAFGQLFVSRTQPGITRGNHFHHTKTEKFFVVEGDAVIRFRKPGDAQVIEYPVSGRDYRVVDIPPGFTHSIENVGPSELVVLFWASEPFDPEHPDTYPLAVLEPAK